LVENLFRPPRLRADLAANWREKSQWHERCRCGVAPRQRNEASIVTSPSAAVGDEESFMGRYRVPCAF